MKNMTLALAALAAMGGLAVSTTPASAWHRHWHRAGVRVVVPAVPVVAPVVVVPRRVGVVYRAPVRVKKVKRVKRVVYR